MVYPYPLTLPTSTVTGGGGGWILPYMYYIGFMTIVHLPFSFYFWSLNLSLFHKGILCSVMRGILSRVEPFGCALANSFRGRNLHVVLQNLTPLSCPYNFFRLLTKFEIFREHGAYLHFILRC